MCGVPTGVRVRVSTKFWEQHWTLCSWWKDKVGNESFIIYLVVHTANHLPRRIHFTVHSCGWFRIKRNNLCLSSATHTWFLAGWKGTALCQLATQDLAAGLRCCFEKFQAVSLSLPFSTDSLTIPCKAGEDSRSLGIGPYESMRETGTLLMEKALDLKG